ncbi:hypothetical protein D3C72_1374400 [compost metagenome]
MSLAAPHLPGGVFHLIHPVQHLQRLLVKQPSRFCQAHRAAVALDELHTQFILQLLYLAAEWRLCDMHLLRRSGEITGGCYGHEIANLAQIHTGKPYSDGIERF